MEFDADKEREGLELAANRSLQPLVQSAALSLLDSSTTSLQACWPAVLCGAAGTRMLGSEPPTLLPLLTCSAIDSHSAPVQDKCRDEGLPTEGSRRDFVLRLGRQFLDQVSQG